MHGFMQLVDRLSVKAIFNRLDKRKLQNELDVHKLYLITSHFDRLAAGARAVKLTPCRHANRHVYLLLVM